MNEQIVNEMVQLHVTSPFQLTKELLPKLMYQEKAAIVAVTSIWGQTGASCEVLYSMVKGGQNAFIKALSKEVSIKWNSCKCSCSWGDFNFHAGVF